MGEENKLPNIANRIFVAPVGSDDFKELPVVENSVKIGFDEGVDIIPPQKDSICFTVDANPKFKKMMMNSPVVRANKMLESIKEALMMFYKFKPPLNRKERRTRARALEKKIARLKIYCRENNIEINNGSKLFAR